MTNGGSSPRRAPWGPLPRHWLRAGPRWTGDSACLYPAGERQLPVSRELPRGDRITSDHDNPALPAGPTPAQAAPGRPRSGPQGKALGPSARSHVRSFPLTGQRGHCPVPGLPVQQGSRGPRPRRVALCGQGCTRGGGLGLPTRPQPQSTASQHELAGASSPALTLAGLQWACHSCLRASDLQFQPPHTHDLHSARPSLTVESGSPAPAPP